MSVRRIGEPALHANHLVHADMADEPQIVTDSSGSRQIRGDALVAQGRAVRDPLSVLRDTGGEGLPIRRDDPHDPDDENTLATASFAIEGDRLDWSVHGATLRSCHPVVAHFAYVMSFLGERAVLLDAGAGTGLDPIRAASSKDILLAASVAPYTRATIETARYAHDRDVPIVAVTDSPVSPLAGIARETVMVPADSPSFFHTIAPALVVGEILAALVAGRGGEASLAAIKRSEAQLTAFGIHWSPPTARPTS